MRKKCSFADTEDFLCASSSVKPTASTSLFSICNDSIVVNFLCISQFLYTIYSRNVGFLPDERLFQQGKAWGRRFASYSANVESPGAGFGAFPAHCFVANVGQTLELIHRPCHM